MEEYFHGVLAPTWAKDEGLVRCLRQEAEAKDWWYETERNRALLATAADRIEALHKQAYLDLPHPLIYLRRLFKRARV